MMKTATYTLLPAINNNTDTTQSPPPPPLRCKPFFCCGLVATVLLACTTNATTTMRIEKIDSSPSSSLPAVPVVVNQTEQGALNVETTTSNNKKKKNLKHFILHIGPPKTGTSHLQFQADRLSSTTLLQDNYHYDGMRVKQDMFKFFRHFDCRTYMIEAMNKTKNDGNESSPNDDDLPDCWFHFLQVVRDLQGKHVVFSCETLQFSRIQNHPEYLEMVRQGLEEVGYELTVVTTYRRLHEWLASVHNEGSHGRNDPWKVWAHQGGKHPPNFYPDVMKSHYIDLTETGLSNWSSWSWEWTWTQMQFVPPSIPVRVMNMHDAHHSLQTKFFCDIVPDAPHTCQLSLEKEQQPEEKSRPSSPFWYDKIAMAAADAGLIDTSRHERRKIKEVIARHQETKLNRTSLEFPWICPPPQDLEKILYMSCTYWEQKLVQPGFADPEGCKASFSDALETKKFCTLDVNATLAAPEWIEFFQTYAPPSPKQSS